MKAYGSLELTQASPAQTFAEPLTLTEVYTYLRLVQSSPADTDQDAMLATLITAAREQAEIEQNRDLVVKQWDLHLDLLLGHDAVAGAAYPLKNNTLYNFGIGYDIPLRHPLQSVDLFQHTDNDGSTTTLTENTDYIVDTNRSLVCPPWGTVWPFFTPQVTSSVLIRYTSGYPASHPFWIDEGARIKRDMLRLILSWWDNRNPDGQQLDVEDRISGLLRMGARPRVF